MATEHRDATDRPTGAYKGTGEARSGNDEHGTHRETAYKAESVRTNAAPGEGRTRAYASTTDRSVGALISELLSDTSRMVRDEVRLAKAEVGSKVDQARHGVVNTAVGAGILLISLIFLLLAVVYALSTFMPPWLAALIVGGVMAAIGYIMLKKGMDELKAKNLAPQKTQKNLSRDAHMVKESV
ncbi:phage holin family protein [Parvularcula oceani]|uniref:phage holin family protein n=1 Tax=Parvularcula oceani TaxID=1247963 RepID=UPI0006893D0A|nr:phage holin family protein [Parvularcula oceani]